MSKELIERLKNEGDGVMSRREKTLLAGYIEELEKERDQLRAQVAILLQGLEDAATSLETIALRSYGDESYLNTVQQMRGYAGSRAGAARETLAATEPKP